MYLGYHPSKFTFSIAMLASAHLLIFGALFTTQSSFSRSLGFPKTLDRHL